MRSEQNSLVKTVAKGEFDKNRKRGRSPKRWADQIPEDTGLTTEVLEEMTEDREKWRDQNVNTWAKPKNWDVQ